MKRFIVVLALMLAMVSTGLATFSPPCSGPDCDYNVINQVNFAHAESGQAAEGCLVDPATTGLTAEQTQTNCAAVMGNGNNVAQSNNANLAGTVLKQVQSNVALVVGSANGVTQANDALETGMGTVGPYGLAETQTQKNLMLIIGTNNHAEQYNTAKAYSDSPFASAGFFGLGATSTYPITQTQTNVGMLLGNKNWVVQSNTATADMFKKIQVDPSIVQTQKNIAFAINNCGQVAVPNSFTGTTSFTWPQVSDPAPATPTISCGDCVPT